MSDERLSLNGIRRLLVDNYIIFFTINEFDKVVTIVRILYSRRDWIDLI